MSANAVDYGPNRDALILEHLPLVRKVAVRVFRRLPSGVQLDELISAGVVGLVEAVDRYEQRRGSFARFAEFRIKGAIVDELRRRDLMSRDHRREANQLEDNIARLSAKLGRTPTEEELAEHMELSVTELRNRMQRVQTVEVFSADNASTQLTATNASPEETLAAQQLTERLAQCIGKLSQRQQQVLHLYYREELRLKDIGAVLDVSESRVSQLLSEATLRLRALMRKETHHA